MARRLHPAAAPAAFAGRLLAEALAAFRSPRLAIAGGSAVEVLRHLHGAPWDHLRLTWVDERVVPFDHADSNRGSAWRGGSLSTPGLELPLVVDGEAPETAAARTTAALQTAFGHGLDVLLLGLGEDGHIASLFPGHPWGGLGPVRVVPDSPKPPALRLTLTLPFLQTASHAVLLATGTAKRGAVERLMDGDPTLPATHLPELDVVTDLE